MVDTKYSVVQHWMRADEHDLISLFNESFHEKEKFWKYTNMRSPLKESWSPTLLKRAITLLHKSASIFCVQLLLDWFLLEGVISGEVWNARINFPGIMSEKNWSYTLPISLEDFKNLSINPVIRKILKDSHRA